MNTHNICFHGEIKKNIYTFQLNKAPLNTWREYLEDVFVCIEVLHPSQPVGVMSSSQFT